MFCSLWPGFSAHGLSQRRHGQTGASRLSRQATRIYAVARIRHLLAQHSRYFAEGVRWAVFGYRIAAECCRSDRTELVNTAFCCRAMRDTRCRRIPWRAEQGGSGQKASGLAPISSRRRLACDWVLTTTYLEKLFSFFQRGNAEACRVSECLW